MRPSSARGTADSMLVIVSHDAGGAEVLSSYAARLHEPYRLVLEGPAVSIFERKLGNIARFDLQDALVGCEQLVTGTSWASDLELRALQAARRAGIPSASYLDHWVHYAERFQSGSETILPDEIWAGDEEALQMATCVFPGLNVRLVPNPYFEDIRRMLAGLGDDLGENAREPSILYLCEPVREHARAQDGDDNAWGYTEESALEYFLANMQLLAPGRQRLVIRPHPSEAADKYSWALDIADDASISSGNTLLEDIAPASIVAGCESTAMVIGLISGKRVVSCIPPGGRACSLPHRDIVHLKDMVAASGFAHG